MRNFFRKFFQVLIFPFRVLFWPIKTLYRGLRNLFLDLKAFFTEEEEDTPLPDVLVKTVNQPQDILYHLNALRKHLFRGALVFFAATVLAAFFTPRILDLLTRPLKGGLDALQAIDVTEPISVFMRVTLLSGFSVSLPYIILELWLFAAPGLSRRARLYGLLAIPAITVFFITGMLFAYYVILPSALPFLVGFLNIRTEPRPSTYIPFVTGLMFWVGVAFQFPLVIFILASMGLVDARMLLRQSRLAIVILAVVAAMITPTIDPINMFLVWGPLVALYYLGVGLALIAQRRRRPKLEASQSG
jgi:sec-independent protein translocase protein TatC